MKLEWDEAKNRANQIKHHVSFEIAIEVFSDPLHRSIPDRIIEGEQRWQSIGHVGDVVVLIVAHT
ncbi:MAG: BrnT family toxin [Hyphomicrobium sp.]